MTSFTNEVTIERSIEDVFAYLADLENVPIWNYAIRRTTKLTPGAVGVATEYEQSRWIPTVSTERLVVTAFDPPSLLEVTGQLGPFAGRLRYELRALSPSRTLLVNSAELAAPTLLGPLSTLLGRRVGAAVAANLAVLRDLLGEEPVPSATTRLS